MSRKSKSIMSENRLVVSRGWNKGEWGVIAKGLWSFFWGVMKMF